MKIVITSICPICGCLVDTKVDLEQYEAYAYGGVLAQDAFPTLSATDRETMISGMCPECQDEIFGSDDEDY
jgi:endogenous inhibitor of DNA gyrase (YacG/DUF329 family)